MDRRLLVLSAAVLAAAAFTPTLAAAGIALTLLLPVLGICGALAAGPLGGLLCLAPGAAALAWRAPDAVAEFTASALAGLLVGELVRRGVRPARAIAWGVLPFAAWTLALAASGFDPIPKEMADTFRRVLAAQTPAGAAPLAPAADEWIALVRRTWIGAEIVFFLGALAAAYAVASRLFADRGWPRFGAFTHFDLPDGLTAVAVGGLAAVVLAQRGASTAVASAGGNLLFLAGVLYAVRGVAIQAFWLTRAGLSSRVVGAVLLVGAILFLPVFPVVAAGLGLFDTWFDFRRLKGPEGGSHPLSVFRHSSSDDRT